MNQSGWGGQMYQQTKERGKYQGRPQAPKIGEFEPYTVPWDPEAFMKKLELYGQEQQKGIYERAAARGTYYGAGGTIPGEIGLAQTQQMALAEYETQMETQRVLAVQRQYLEHIKARYGIQSREYELAYEEYMQRLQAKWSAQEALVTGAFEMGGTVLPFLL